MLLCISRLPCIKVFEWVVFENHPCFRKSLELNELGGFSEVEIQGYFHDMCQQLTLPVMSCDKADINMIIIIMLENAAFSIPTIPCLIQTQCAALLCCAVTKLIAIDDSYIYIQP